MLQNTRSCARVSTFLATVTLVIATLGSSANAAPSSLQSAFNGAPTEFRVPANILLAVSMAQYSIPAGQRYVAYATFNNLANYHVITTQTEFYLIRFNHRLAYVKASDVDVIRN